MEQAQRCTDDRMVAQRTSQGDLKTTRRAWVRNQAEFRMQALRKDGFHRAAKLLQPGNNDPDSRSRVQFELATRPQGRVPDFLGGVGKRESPGMVAGTAWLRGQQGHLDTCGSQRLPEIFLPWGELIEAEKDSLLRQLRNPRTTGNEHFERRRRVDPALIDASCGEALGPS